MNAILKQANNTHNVKTLKTTPMHTASKNKQRNRSDSVTVIRTVKVAESDLHALRAGAFNPAHVGQPVKESWANKA